MHVLRAVLSIPHGCWVETQSSDEGGHSAHLWGSKGDGAGLGWAWRTAF